MKKWALILSFFIAQLPASEIWESDLDAWLDEGMDIHTLEQISKQIDELGLGEEEPRQEDEIDLRPLRRIYEQAELYRDTQIRIAPKELEFRRRETLPPFRAVLLRNSTITRIDGGERLYTDRPIFVRAQEQFPGSQYALLFDKNDEPIFYVLNSRLSSIEEVTNLLPGVDATVTYEAPTRSHSVDSSFSFENNFSLHQESLNATAIARLHDSESSSGSIQRIQYQAVTMTGTPYNFGASLSFQSGRMGTNAFGEMIGLSGVSFGPLFKGQFFKKDVSYWEWYLRGEKSITLSSSDEVLINRLSSVSWGVGLEWTRETFFGPFFLGAEFRQQYISLKNSSDSVVKIDPSERTLTALGVTLGYRWRLTL